LFKRVREFLDEVKEQYKDKNILLVTHGGVSRAIYFYFNELPKDGMIEKINLKNCEIKQYKL
jgi:probable phosphoglycerate mutase